MGWVKATLRVGTQEVVGSNSWVGRLIEPLAPIAGGTG